MLIIIVHDLYVYFISKGVYNYQCGLLPSSLLLFGKDYFVPQCHNEV
jgi:hypothetical protein